VGGGARGGGTTGMEAAGNLLSLALSSHVEERE
jgi:NADH dehydrogenase FAD-containing subunit